MVWSVSRITTESVLLFRADRVVGLRYVATDCASWSRDTGRLTNQRCFCCHDQYVKNPHQIWTKPDFSPLMDSGLYLVARPLHPLQDRHLERVRSGESIHQTRVDLCGHCFCLDVERYAFTIEYSNVPVGSKCGVVVWSRRYYSNWLLRAYP